MTGLEIKPYECFVTGQSIEMVTGMVPVAFQLRTWEMGQVVLGTPVGPAPYMNAVVQTAVDDVQHIADRLPYIADTQTEFQILRACLNACKINHYREAGDQGCGEQR